MNAELFLLTIGLVGFLVVLIGLTALLSIARQVRIQLMTHTVITSASIAATGEDTLPASPLLGAAPAAPAPEKLRQAVRAAASDPVTLSIEPESGPTRQQRAVQRLIDRLKEESARAAAPVSPV